MLPNAARCRIRSPPSVSVRPCLAPAWLIPTADVPSAKRADLARLYPTQLLHETLEIASRCHFSLDEWRYEYPEELVPAGERPFPIPGP